MREALALTENIEDYLKAIYIIQDKKQKVTTNDIAESLAVSAPSASSMIKKLADMKLLLHEPYQGVTLTETGVKIALEIIRHHRLIELYLVEALGYSWDEVHQEAEKLEHVISEQFEEKIAAFLGDPKFDPHGHPIPTKDGKMPADPIKKLADYDDNSTLMLASISDKDPEKLRYLASFGLYPGVRVRILRKEPYGGIMWIQVNQADYPISLEVAKEIYVDTP